LKFRVVSFELTQNALPTSNFKLQPENFSANGFITRNVDNLTLVNLNGAQGVKFAARFLTIMNSVQVLGLAAGSLTTVAFLPQVIKTWRSGSAKDLSLGMFSFFCLGVLLWLVYGILVMDIPVIAANMVTLMLASTLLYFKLRFKE